MPNIRQQHADKLLIHLQGSDGREFQITRAEIMAIYNAQSGNAASRKAATITIIKNQAVAAIGSEQVTAADLGFDFTANDANAHMACVVGVA